MVERKTKHGFICPLEGKRSDEVMVTMIAALQPFVGNIHSITLDDGERVRRTPDSQRGSGDEDILCTSLFLPGTRLE